MKILAIQFRYLGDAALMTPALRAIREHFPGSTLHLLVAEEIVPLLQHLPGLARVWAFPRRRGRAKPTLSWPVIRALRQEHFDRSVEFGGNDRGAIVSLLTKPEPAERLDRFYLTINTPVGQEQRLEALKPEDAA